MITIVWIISIMAIVLVITFWRILLVSILYTMPVTTAIASFVFCCKYNEELQTLFGMGKSDPIFFIIVVITFFVVGIFFALILWTGILNPINDWYDKNWNNFMKFLQGERFKRRNPKVMKFKS